MLHLSVSYRLPPDALAQARQFAREFLPRKLVDLPEEDQGAHDPYPCQLRWVQCDPANAWSVCADEVIAMMMKAGRDGLANADITLLADLKSSGAGIVEQLADKKIRVINTFSAEDDRRQKMAFFMGDARLKARTPHSFKGWEGRLLVMHVTSLSQRESRALLYAGLTRLKRSTEGSALTVVCSAPELEQYGKSFPDHIDQTRNPIRLSLDNLGGISPGADVRPGL